MAGCCRPDGDGIRLLIRLTPRASVDRIDGEDSLADGRTVLKVRVRAVAEKGRANTALIKLMARAFAVAPSQVDLVKGATARVKTLRISGNPDALLENAGQFPG